MAKEKARLSVSGMSCEHCVKTVQQTLESVDGVLKVKVHLKHARADVQYDSAKVSAGALAETVTQAGYETALD